MTKKSSSNSNRHRRGGTASIGGQKQKQNTIKIDRNNNNNNNNNATTTNTITTTTNYQPHNSLLLQLDDGERWYEYDNNNNNNMNNNNNKKKKKDNNDNDTTTSFITEKPTVSYETIQKYRNMADSIYKREIYLYRNNNNVSSKDRQWVESTIKNGTLKDRIAAMSVTVSTNPIHEIDYINQLLQMVTNNTNARIIQLASEALEDLFINTLLPSNRKLITLTNRPLHLYENSNNNKTNKTTKNTLSPRILLLWRYEELIKEIYDQYVKQYIIQTLNNDATNIEYYLKITCLKTCSLLLQSCVENENILLNILVNKLGDPNRKVTATASYQLRNVLNQHPAMIIVIAREVQQLSFRPNLSQTALYNTITFLNQLQLNNTTYLQPLVISLIDTYFRLFETVIAFQEINNNGNSSKGSSSKIGKRSKRKNNNKNKKKNNKNNNNNNNNINDEQHVIGMKSRLLSALLTGINRAYPYVKEESNTIIDKHIDALYKVIHTAPSSIARTQALMLLFHITVNTTTTKGSSTTTTTDDDDDHEQQPVIITKTSSSEEKQKQKQQRNNNIDRFYRALYSTISTSLIGITNKHMTMYYNLLYKAMKYETNVTRLVAYTKCILSCSLHCNSSAIITSSLFLINQIIKDGPHPTLLSCYNEILYRTDSIRVLDLTKREPRGALVVLDDDDDDKNKIKNNNNNNNIDDDEMKSPGWEMSLLKYQYHPSVQKFVNDFGTTTMSKYSGDPLHDFAFITFLDKFVYRNPKSIDKKLQNKCSNNNNNNDNNIAAKRTNAIRSGMNTSIPVNDPNFINNNKKDNNINVDEEFFLKFFIERAKRDKVKGIVRKTDNNKKSKDYDSDDIEQELDDVIDKEEYRDVGDRYNENDINFDWDTDEEEEAFVDSLAQKIMEDSMDGPGIDELDDEDPDMDGWDDDYDDDDDSAVNKKRGKDQIMKVNRKHDEDDAFMDNDSDSDDDDDDDTSSKENDFDPDLMQNNDNDESDDDDDDDLDNNPFLDDDDSDDYITSSDDEEAPQLIPYNNGDETTFASAEEYSNNVDTAKSSKQKQQKRSIDDDNYDEIPTKKKSKKGKK